MKIKKEIWIVINLIVVVMLFTYFNILLQYPKNNEHLLDKNIELKWKGNYGNYKLYVDDDKEFKSPIIKEVTGNFYRINDLDFGTYYWKIETEKVSSATWRFTIDSEVAINLVQSDESVEIKNVGNTDLSLEINNPITGLSIVDLPYQESKEFGDDNSLYVGKQK